MRASLVSRAVALGLALAASGCGPQFDPSSKVSSLRILGVTKSAPYARPGETVTLDMLWHDASKAAPRTVRAMWIGGCFDPPGDLYYGCFQQLYQAAAQLGGSPSPGPAPTLGFNSSSFSLEIPTSLPDGQPILRSSPDPRMPSYGVAYVFFALCAGELGFEAPTSEADFPLVCRDASGKALGPDDFVAGYSSIYLYDGYKNQNPELSRTFTFNGQADVPADCVGDECLVTACSLGLPEPTRSGGCDEPSPLEPTEPIDCAGGDARCVPHCDDNGGPDCPELTLKPAILRASVEPDQLAADTGGERGLTEQMWVRYYATSGTLASEVRLVNDAKRGWNEDYGTTFRAPKRPGPVTVWAVVQDNRGGAAWTRMSLVVR